MKNFSAAFSWGFASLLSILLTACSSIQSPTSPTKQVNTRTSLASAATTPNTPEIPVKATPQTQSSSAVNQIKSWEIKGAIGVQEAKEAWSATFTWQQLGPQHYAVQLVGAAGFGTVSINGKPGYVKLVNAKNQTFSAKSSEALFKQQTGLYLPVSYLYYWVRGLPVPSMASAKTYSQNNQISTITQGGWITEFTRYARVSQFDLPSKIIITNPQMKIKIVINSWLVQ